MQADVPPRASSKYDFVKIKVWLGEHLEHYYVLSRFLIARALELIKIPEYQAIKISLELKKYFVDNGKLDINQTELETVLFSMLRSKGFGEEYVNRFKMVNKFQQQRRPLIVLIAGAPCVGKSMIAHQLASRLNLPNVLQTDSLHELLSQTQRLQLDPLWTRKLENGPGLISEYQQECRTVRKALSEDLHKCLKEGKSAIIEGTFLDPGLYLPEFQVPSKSSSKRLYTEQEHSESASSLKEKVDDESKTHVDGHQQKQQPSLRYSSTPKKWDAGVKKEKSLLELTETLDDDLDEQLQQNPIFIPVVLQASEADRAIMSHGVLRDGEALDRAGLIQEYLCRYAAANVHIIQTGVKRFENAIDDLHNLVLASLDVTL